MFDRDGAVARPTSPWIWRPTPVRLSAQLHRVHRSLISTVNNIAERDQYLGRPIINVTDERPHHHEEPAARAVCRENYKMWRKLGAWFWLATQNIDDLPARHRAMLNMIEWWICLSMPPDEVEKIADSATLAAQKALMLSARKEAGKFTEGVILSKSMEVLFRAVPPSLYLALAQTEPEERPSAISSCSSGISELMPPSRWPRRSTGHAASSRRPWLPPESAVHRRTPWNETPSVPMAVQAFRRRRWPPAGHGR